MGTQVIGPSGKAAAVRVRYEYGLLGESASQPRSYSPPVPQYQPPASSAAYSSQRSSEALANAHLYPSRSVETMRREEPMRRGPRVVSPPKAPKRPTEVVRPSDNLLMYNHEAMALYHENQRLAESIAAWENLMSPVPSVYETSDNHVIEGFDFDDTIYLPPRTSKKPVHIRCCTSKYSHGIIEIAGLTDTLFVEISSNVRIMVSAVLKNIVVVGCSNIELVIGGNPPKVVLVSSMTCTQLPF